MKKILLKRTLMGLAAVSCLLFATAGAVYAETVKASDIPQTLITEETNADGTPVEETAAEQPVINVTGFITSCTIRDNKTDVDISLTSSGDTANTDGKIYIFEQTPYRTNLEGRTDYLDSCAAGTEYTMSLPLNKGTTFDRLYNSYILAVYDGVEYKAVSEPHYITNPEVVAEKTSPYYYPNSKKGLAIEIDMLDDAYELGVKHASTNIAFNQIIGDGIDYVYDGKTYHFSQSVIAEYDKTVTAFNKRGITVTAIILNGWNESQPDLFRPGVYPVTSPYPTYYYMFNVETQAGFEQTRAIAAFLAQRYNGSDSNHGKIANWIIGNEINNQQWNYGGSMALTDYINAYEKAFRVFYTAIKSSSASDRVYYSLDNNWNNSNEKAENFKYGGRETVDAFNSAVKNRGQIDWSLAYHAYSYPMVEPEFWDDAQTGMFTKTMDTPVLNFYNINVLTDYLQQEAYKNADGNVRHVILTEAGFSAKSASRGDVPDLQAAAYAYAYYMVDSNPYIDSYILGRQVDAPAEVNTGVSLGLWSCDMSKQDRIVASSRRKIWAVFKNIDRKSSTLENTNFAKSIIGINKWSDVIPGFKWSDQE